MHVDLVTEAMIGAAIAVHRELGPGLLESAYEACLAFELGQRGLSVERQRPLPVVYRGQRLDCGYRLDLFVELKTVEQINPLHEAQLMSYLKLSGCTVGLLINFNVRQLTQGLKRLVLNYTPPVPDQG